MSRISSDPMNVLLDRAYRLRCASQRATGRVPECFIVSDDEYDVLCRSDDRYGLWRRCWPTSCEVYLMGMRVVRRYPQMRVHDTPLDCSHQEPLPPIDDLDEGLTCCDRRYPTFLAYMAHRRAHQEA
jgi:hypothetical protein